MSDTENYASESSEPQTSPLQAFFAGFAATGFTYKPSRSTKKNFDHLCKVSGWAGNSPARTAARQDFKDALVQEFNFLFGISGDDIAAWHKLCKAIKIDPAPDSVDECRKVGDATKLSSSKSVCSQKANSSSGTHTSTSSISLKPSGWVVKSSNSTPSTTSRGILRARIDSSQKRTRTRVDCSRNCYGRSSTPTLGRGAMEAKRERQGRRANGKLLLPPPPPPPPLQ